MTWINTPIIDFIPCHIIKLLFLHKARAILRRRLLRILDGRLEGVALSSDGSSITLDDRDAGQVTVPLVAIERARTVFVWGAESPTPKRHKAAQQAKKG